MKNQKTAQIDSSKNLEKHFLCNFCSSRLKLKKTIQTTQKCFICKDIFERVDNFVTRIVDNLVSYDFSNFETGVIIKPSLMDRDDHIKSEFKIKGVNSVKTKINHELSKRIARKTNTKINHIDADLVIKVNFKDDSYKIQSKSVIVYGRYIKKSRMLPQKPLNCINCLGKGCHACHFHGLENFDSVEGQITKFLIKKFGCEQVKINCIGGEEKSSLVLGNGRPFFAKIINPKKRKSVIRIKPKLEGIKLLNLRKISEQPKGQISFKSKIDIIIKTENYIKNKTLNNLQILEMPLKISINGKKTVVKKIYKINFKRLASKRLKINMYADGGIPIKSLIQNHEITPNFTYLLQNNCQCVQFDFKKIDVVS